MSENSSDNRYTIAVREVGMASQIAGVSGKSKIEVKLFQDEKALQHFTTNVDLQGEFLEKENIVIEWTAQNANLVVRNQNEEYTIYRFYWEDFVRD